MADVNMFVKFLVLMLFSYVHANSQFDENYEGTIKKQTHGQPWPRPHRIVTGDTQFSLSPVNFVFQYVSTDIAKCDVLTEAFVRYRFLTFPSVSDSNRDSNLRFKSRPRATDSLASINTLMVHLKSPCSDGDYPSLESDESYDLDVNKDAVYLSCASVWGALRGLETFSQIVHETTDGEYVVNDTTINDTPRFRYRATMLDTSRHYLNMDVLKQNLDAMAQNKFNIFHWHIVDDPSFPYESYTFPELSRLGAFTQAHIYTQTQVKEIIEYARLRGIRVIPEFDSPGHSQSWGPGQRGLLTPCYSEGKENGQYGPINPILNSSYTFLDKFFTEIAAVFPDKYVHIGGDEVSFKCWQSNPNITHFMEMMQFGENYALLEQFYINKLLKIVKEKQRGYIVWQEVIDNKAKVAPDTVVDVWKSGWVQELAKVTALGYTTVLSSPWYLNYISYGIDWPKYYTVDPHDFQGSAKQKALVIGGQTCMWGEFVDSTNVISRFWPRASAVAERLWSPADVIDLNEASPRLEEQRCRMLRRGLNVEPVTGPGFCAHEVKP